MGDVVLISMKVERIRMESRSFQSVKRSWCGCLFVQLLICGNWCF